MRVLTLTNPLPTTTRPTSLAPVARQIKSLQALGIDMDIMEFNGPAKAKYLQALPLLQQRIQKADLVHAHYGYSGWVARCQIQKPVVVSFMGSDLHGTYRKDGSITTSSQLIIQINRWYARTVNAVIVKSKQMANVVKPMPAHVIPNGVDLDLFQPMTQKTARAMLGWSDTDRYVLFPGNPTNIVKGFDLAQQALKESSRIMKESLQLITLRRVSPDHVPLYMNACDAMVLTSSSEGSPNVVKEAMACNLPIATVPVGDVCELLNGIDQCVICDRDPEALGASLADLLMAERRSNARCAILEKELDLESVALRIKNVYAQVLSSSH